MSSRTSDRTKGGGTGVGAAGRRPHVGRRVNPRLAAASALAVCACLGWADVRSDGAAKVWNNSGTDFDAAGTFSTTAGVATTALGSADVAYFNTSVGTQPNVTASLTIAGVYFNASSATGYDLAGSSGTVLTLNGYGSSTNPTSSSTAAALSTAATGTDTIDVAVALAPASGTTSRLQTLANGGNLILNGVVSGSATAALNVFGGSTLQLSAANTYTGGTTLTAVSLTQTINGVSTVVPATVAVGNDGAFGTGTVTFVSGNTLAAVGGARTIGNAVVLGGNGILAGGNAFTFTGPFTSSGSNGRTLTFNNTGGATLAGPVYLAADNATARALTIAGTTAVVISGPVANNAAGNTLASTFAVTGAGPVTLSNAANTYTGVTNVSSGSTLLLSTAGTNNIATSGRISVFAGSTLDVTGVTGTGGFALANGQTLAGAGTVNGNVTVASGATVTGGSGGTTTGTPGPLTTNGTQTWADGGHYGVDLNGTTGDELVMTGLTVVSGSQTTFNINLLPAAAVTGPITIAVDKDGSATNAFANPAILSALTQNLTVSGSSAAGSGYTLTSAPDTTLGGYDLILNTAAAPEPTSLALIIAAATPLLSARRRQTRRPGTV